MTFPPRYSVRVVQLLPLRFTLHEEHKTESMRTSSLEGGVNYIARDLLALPKLKLGLGKVRGLLFAFFGCFGHLE